MLGRRAFADGRLPFGIEHLHPLALADRIVAEHRHAVPRQQDADPLIGLGRLAVGAVAARDQDAGKRRLAVGKVERRRDVMARAGSRRSPARRGNPDTERVPIDRGFSGVRGGRSPSDWRKKVFNALCRCAICSGVVVEATSRRRRARSSEASFLRNSSSMAERDGDGFAAVSCPGGPASRPREQASTSRQSCSSRELHRGRRGCDRCGSSSVPGPGHPGDGTTRRAASPVTANSAP